MVALRDIRTGVIVNVSEETAKLLDTGYEPVKQEPAKRPATRQAK